MYNQLEGQTSPSPTDGSFPRPLPNIDGGPGFGYSVNPPPPPPLSSHPDLNHIPNNPSANPDPITQPAPHPPFGIGVGHGHPPSDQSLLINGAPPPPLHHPPPHPRSLSCDTTMGQNAMARHHPCPYKLESQSQTAKQRPTTPGLGQGSRPVTPGLRPRTSRSTTMPTFNQVHVNTNTKPNPLDPRLVYDPTSNRFYQQDGMALQQNSMGNGMPPTPTSAGIPNVLASQQPSANTHPQRSTTPVASRTPTSAGLVMYTQQQQQQVHQQTNVQNPPQRSTTPAASYPPASSGLVLHNQQQQQQQQPQSIGYNQQQRCTTPIDLRAPNSAGLSSQNAQPQHQQPQPYQHLITYNQLQRPTTPIASHAPNSTGLVFQNPQQQQQHQSVVYNQPPQRSTTPAASFPLHSTAMALHHSHQQAFTNSQPQRSTTPSTSQAPVSAGPMSHHPQQQQQQLPMYNPSQHPAQQYAPQSVFHDPHFECQLKIMGLQAMLENTQQALNRVDSEGHPDGNQVMHLVQENQHLRAALTAKSDPRLQRQDGGEGNRNDEVTDDTETLRKENEEMTAIIAGLKAQLLKETRSSSSLRGHLTSLGKRNAASTQAETSRFDELTTLLAEEKRQSAIKTNQVLAYQYKLTQTKVITEARQVATEALQSQLEQQFLENANLRQRVTELEAEQRKQFPERIDHQQAPAELVVRSAGEQSASKNDLGDSNSQSTNRPVAAGDPTIEALVAQINKLETELADYQQPWLKDGQDSDRTRFEQLLAAYEEEKLEKERLRHELSQANDHITRRELAISHRENKQETTKLQINQLGEPVIDLTASSSPANEIDPGPKTPSANTSDRQGDGDVSIDMDIDMDADMESAYANDIQNLQLNVAAAPMSNGKGIIDEKNDQDQNSHLPVVNHIHTVCSGSLDLMRWVEKLVEQEFAERPLADRQCHRAMGKFGKLMDEVKGSIGWLQTFTSVATDGVTEDQSEKSEGKK